VRPGFHDLDHHRLRRGRLDPIRHVSLAKTVFPLTGTPVRNEPEDVDVFTYILGLDRFPHGHDSADPRALLAWVESARGYFAHYDPSLSLPADEYRRHYPATVEREVRHATTWPQMFATFAFNSGVYTRVRGRRYAFGGTSGRLSKLSTTNGVVDLDDRVWSSKLDRGRGPGREVRPPVAHDVVDQRVQLGRPHAVVQVDDPVRQHTPARRAKRVVTAVRVVAEALHAPDVAQIINKSG